ncbi:uncharacterized protein LOC113273826 [Papaver somniferum]|uniref:uncharacterized protein LOC113273826 n=1 Tax=Papaver somniferum TaxID=3469 RepID=UPI000E6F4CCC|nr:uncharacterized protein LOC113273826 [Papaver somniferum]
MLDKKKSYATRLTGLKKKVHEFSTLVDVDACMLVYGGPKQRGSHHRRRDDQPETFPENRRDVIRIVNRYLGIPKEERVKRHEKLSDDNGKNKIEEEDDDNKDELVNNQKRGNGSNSDGLEWDDQYDKLSADELQRLIDSVESKIGIIDEKIQVMENPRSGGVSDPRVVANDTTQGISNNNNNNSMLMQMQMQPIYVLQPAFNQNLAAANNGSTGMVPMGVPMGMINPMSTANGENVPYPIIPMVPMMAARPTGRDNMVPMMAVRPSGRDNNNQEVYGNHQGQQVAYFVPQAGNNQGQQVAYIVPQAGNNQGQQVGYFVPQAGNNQGQQVAYIVPQAFVQPTPSTRSFIPDLMPGASDA